MQAKKFGREQLSAALKETEAGTKTKELSRNYGISGATFYELDGPERRDVRREGRCNNDEIVHRPYREAGLTVQLRRRRRIGLVVRTPLPKPLPTK